MIISNSNNDIVFHLAVISVFLKTYSTHLKGRQWPEPWQIFKNNLLTISRMTV